MPTVPGVTHSWVDIGGGVRLHVAEAGEGDPLVLLHGWPGHWFCWRELIPALAERFRVLAVDLRGFGWSDAPPDGYRKDELADDLLALLDALGLARVKLLAHDWGGVVGFHLCLRAPERIERYVVLNTGHLWMPWRRVLRLWPLYTYQWLMVAPVVWRWGPRWVAAGIGQLAKKGAWSDEARDSFVAQWAERDRAQATRELYRRYLFGEAWEIGRGRYRDERLRVPTLFLHGDRDPVIRGDAMEEFAGEADDYEFRRLPGLSHFPAEEDPREILRRTLEYFDAGVRSPAIVAGS